MRTGALLLLAALMLGGPLSAGAHAEGPTRAEYVETLEAVCRPRVEATQRAMKGVRADVRAERDAIAAAKFRRGARLFGGTVDRISGVPRPEADLAKLKKWFSYLGEQERYLQRITANLEADRIIAVERAISRFVHNGQLANNVVLAFGFNYCSFRLTRFGQ